jgi:hypothetical protein
VSGACGTHGRAEKTVADLVGKPEGKRPLARRWRRGERGIKMYIMEIDFKGVEWVQLTQDEPSGSTPMI